MDAIRARHAEIGTLIEKGDFAAVWVPAFQAKDLALALEPHLAHLLERVARGTPSRRSSAWCRARGVSTPSATPATARRWSWPIASFGEALADVAAAFTTQ